MLAIQDLIAEGFTDGIEHSNADVEDTTQTHTFWSLSAGSQAGEGRWAQGRTPIGDQEIIYLTEAESLAAASTDIGLLPPPDPKLFATYDGNQGKGILGDAKRQLPASSARSKTP